MVDMNSPMTLNLDIENMLKPPYNDNPRVLNIISDTRKN